MEDAVELRKQLKAAAGDAPAPSFNDLVVKACALALREFPRANGAYRDGSFELYSRVNVGVAVAGQDALVVPTIFDADRKSPRADRRARPARWPSRCATARSPRPSSPAARSRSRTSACTASTRFVAGDQPAAGRDPRRRRDGAEAGRARRRDRRPRRAWTLTLTCDHRILYGADAARFLARIRELLEQPLALAL